MNTPELPPASYLQVDLFPAKVSGPSITGGVIDRVRVVVTDSHIHILRLARNGDIELEHTAELASLVRAPEVGVRGMRVTTAEGDEIEFQKSLNCGCGMSRMKTAKFFHPVLPMQALPLV